MLRLRPALAAAAAALLAPAVVFGADFTLKNVFSRVATFHICEQIDPTCNTDDVTNAETISYYEKDGVTVLAYSNSEGGKVGFVDITDSSSPMAAGEIDLGGEPTTVTTIDNKYAVVGVNTSPDFVNPSGVLAVIDVDTKSILREITLPGQPDAVDATTSYIAIAIENERDEDLGEGIPPQLPAGELSIIDIVDLEDPETWTVRSVSMTNLNGCLYPEDPEPEYVHIDDAGEKVVVTMQENDCIAVVDLASGGIISSAAAGSVELSNIDLTKDGVILQDGSASKPREPDGVAWIGDTGLFATANEGDIGNNGSRGWSIFDTTGGSIAPVWDSGNEMELWTARVGHYPEARSGKKGNEPENLLYAAMDNGKSYIFVLSERSSVVFVYDVTEDPKDPTLMQILPVGAAPEGVVFIPSKNIVAIASELDERAEGIRSSITIFELNSAEEMDNASQYPTLVSDIREFCEDTYIPFSALSGLASAASPTLDSGDETILYSVEESFFNKSRILKIDISKYPAVVKEEKTIMDSDDVLFICLSSTAGVDVATVINDDKTVNIDPEGVAVSSTGGFWIASEGSDIAPNVLLKTDDEAKITDCVLLPAEFPPQGKFGFDGVAEDGAHVVIPFHVKLGEDAHPRIAVYNSEDGSWKYAFYPLDAPASQNGGGVGLSDISPLGGGEFLVLERDSQGGPDAVIKQVTKINLGDFSFEDGAKLTKEVVVDLIPEMLKTNGQIIEKPEGLAVTKSGDIWINTNNDGTISGEQALLKVGNIEIMVRAEVAEEGEMEEEVEEVEEVEGQIDKEEGDKEKKEGDKESSGARKSFRVIATFFAAVAMAVY